MMRAMARMTCLWQSNSSSSVIAMGRRSFSHIETVSPVALGSKKGSARPDLTEIGGLGLVPQIKSILSQLSSDALASKSSNSIVGTLNTLPSLTSTSISRNVAPCEGVCGSCSMNINGGNTLACLLEKEKNTISKYKCNTVL